MKSSLQASQQKLDVPQWQAQTHQRVYIKKVCSVWELTKMKLCSFLNKKSHCSYLIQKLSIESSFLHIFSNTEADTFRETIHLKGVMASQAALHLWNLSFNQDFLLATGCGSFFAFFAYAKWFYRKSCLYSLIYRVQTVGLQCMSTYCRTKGLEIASWVTSATAEFWICHVDRYMIYWGVWCSFFQHFMTLYIKEMDSMNTWK